MFIEMQILITHGIDRIILSNSCIISFIKSSNSIISFIKSSNLMPMNTSIDKIILANNFYVVNNHPPPTPQITPHIFWATRQYFSATAVNIVMVRHQTNDICDVIKQNQYPIVFLFVKFYHRQSKFYLSVMYL